MNINFPRPTLRLIKEYIQYSSDGEVKWLSNLDNLKPFMFALFGDVGKWSSPGGSDKSCRHDSITITWYAHKKVLTCQSQVGNVLINKSERLEGRRACGCLLLDMMEVKSDIKRMNTIINYIYKQESSPAKYCFTKSASSVNTCEVGIQTDIEPFIVLIRTESIV